MKDADKQKEFIELRAKNWSYQKISDKIGVSKPTLIKWNNDFKYEIKTLHSIEMEGLYQEYKTTIKQRVEYLGELHQKLVKELKNRDLSDVKTDKVLDMLIKTSNELEVIKDNNKLSFHTKESIDKYKDHDTYMEQFNLTP